MCCVLTPETHCWLQNAFGRNVTYWDVAVEPIEPQLTQMIWIDTNVTHVQERLAQRAALRAAAAARASSLSFVH